mgnify:CR=1 FL=1
MQLLDIQDYKKVKEQLSKVTFNYLFARSVVEGRVAGKIYVDDTSNPSTFYILHPYGMSLLLGDCGNKDFNIAFKSYALNQAHTRVAFEWMQVYPDDWSLLLEELFHGYLIPSANNTARQEKGIIELNTRVNFKFEEADYTSCWKKNIDKDISIKQVDDQLFHKMQGSVVPSNFWNNADDFIKNGLAFALFYKEELASMAFSSFWFDDQFEMGIETKEKFRGMGFAEFVCSALIDYCIEKRHEPIWACRLENTASYKLAQKLGFQPICFLPYYRLSK